MKKLNNVGAVHFIMLGIMATTFTFGIIQTANNGVLKKNGQTIWCKMKGIDAATCDEYRK